MNPGGVAPVSALVSAMAASIAAVGREAQNRQRRDRTAVARGLAQPERPWHDFDRWAPKYRRAREGTGEGERWWEGHVGRNDLLYRLAYYVRFLGATRGAAERLLHEVNGRNRPPLPEAELQQVLTSAWRDLQRSGRRPPA